jgi:tetratricopeptide (TPR) repeat protein
MSLPEYAEREVKLPLLRGGSSHLTGNMRHLMILSAVFFLFVSAGAAQSPPGQVPSSVLHQIATEFEQGKVPEAERGVRTALEKAPRDPAALSLLGVILDAQQRYGEAESAYQQALAVVPGSPGILNNLGNHYLAQGKANQARAAFLKVVGANPGHPNANLQLAQLSVAARQGAAALKYLDRLPAESRDSPPVEILRARAMKLAGQNKAAGNLLAEVESKAGNDPSVAFSIGMTLAEWQRYGDAENAFTRALDADPTNFDILYNLGLAAQHAAHTTRALEVYRVALQQRPNDADCLFNLASIYMQTGHADEAIMPLMQAHSAAPERPEILFALAQASQDIGFYGDAATAIDQYLQLKPEDDIARRERGFCLIRSKSLDQGLEDLRWYTRKHPKDARGLYELAIGETVRESDKTLQHLDQALAIDPTFNAARFARAVLYYEKGRTEDSVADVKLLLSKEPDNFRALDVLGQDYTRLERYPEAAEVLARAAELAPKDPKILTHYAHVLSRMGRKEDAEKVLADFRAFAAAEGPRPNQGLFDYLNLPPEKQYAKYMENLQRNIALRPEDPNLRVQLGKTYLQQGKPDQAIEAFRLARKLTSDPDLLSTCGLALFDFGQYAASREFLEPAVAANPSAADLRLNLVITVFHTAGPEAGLQVLDGTPPEQRKGDYFLLRAQILDAMNKPEEAAEALNRGFAAAPTRADLYFQAALFLIKHEQYKRAIGFLEQANHAIPDAPELQLLQAMACELVRDHDNAMRVLARIESHWPEWALPYMVQGITLAIRLRSAEAEPVLKNAIALGADNGITNYYLALVIVNSTPERVEEAHQAISKALQMTPDDVYVQSLAGKIDFLQKDYPSALDHLNAALRMWPEMSEAHQTLAGVYKAMGDKEKSIAELKEILRIKQENPTADQTPPFPMEKLLFSVQAPSHPRM